MRNGKKQIAINTLGGGDFSDNHVGNTPCKHTQYFAVGESPSVVPFILSDMRQIAFNKPNRGGYSPCVTAHYHKVGWKDILNANQIPHFGIIVITNKNANRN